MNALAVFRKKLELSRHNHTDLTRLMLISQLPPPVHGSTIMTKTLMSVFSNEGINLALVDRRFSSSIASVGKFAPQKLFAAVGLVARLITQSRQSSRICIFFVTTRGPSFVVDWVLSEVLRLLHVTSINYIHTRGFRDLARRRGPWKFMVKRLLSQSQLTVCLGPSLADDIAPWVQKTSIALIPNTPDGAPTFEGVKPSPGGPPYLLFLSNLFPAKGASDFVQMAHVLSKDFPDLNYVIAGPKVDLSHHADLVRAQANGPAAENIRLVGSVEKEEKWALLKGATFLVFPSTYEFEAQPLTIIEAFACGTPVAAYDTGGIRDLVETSKNGILVEPGDWTGLASNLASALRSSDQLDALRLSTAKCFRQLYSRDAYATEWLTAIRRVGFDG